MIKPEGIYYADYLQLDKLLDAQHPESGANGSTPAHDELLFIIVHQAYELWFKQILFELRFIIDLFCEEVVDDRKIGRVVAMLQRVHAIQRLMIEQIGVMETMTPLDFLEFRDLLIPASGFQSVQFKELEVRLGITRAMRDPTDREFIYSRLRPSDIEYLVALEQQPNLFEVTERWLERLPFLSFGGFEFWQEYQRAVNHMLESDHAMIASHSSLTDELRQHQLRDLEGAQARFQALFDEHEYEVLRARGEFRFSHQAFLAALFIHLYRDEPMLQLPFCYLTALAELDQNFTTWRSRHAIMVHRMLGSKIGTGGSSGHEYLRRTTEQNQVFKDLFSLSTFLIRRSDIPVLPEAIRESMSYRLEQ